jgi:AcrR family transcriptional regulator
VKFQAEPAQAELSRPRGRPRLFDREAALDTAMMLFWRQGYEGTSLSDLTTGMGIRPASLYAAFGSKEALFMEALERYRSGVGSGLPRIVNNAPSAREAVRMLLEGTAATVTRRAQPRGCMIVLSALHGFAEPTNLDLELQRCRAADQHAILERLRRGAAEGELPKKCDPGAMAAFYMAILQGMSVQARDGASKATLMGIAEQAMRAWPER